jgi:hypothetical protein
MSPSKQEGLTANEADTGEIGKANDEGINPVGDVLKVDQWISRWQIVVRSCGVAHRI